MPKGQDSAVAYLFPGQGAQAVGMGRELYNESPAARAIFDEVDEALGRSLTDTLFNGPEDDLRQTVNA
ncbi:MAG: ACP S-malonyltransferase, partial [Chloroflexi bacterium]|nr:ACP S-malonyltransferase [Chloroflexota bacterium]